MTDPWFKECAACAAKPGSPTLCEACIHNRDLISSMGPGIKGLNKTVKEQRETIGKLTKQLADARRAVAMASRVLECES